MTDGILDREKVIRGLECHAAHGFEMCCDCPYYPDELEYEDDDDLEGVICEEKLASDALAMLKEQEARVMTLDEIMENGGEEPIYLECPDVVGVTPVIYQPDAFEDGYLGFNGSWRNSGYYHGMNYGKTWRCWTARPSDGQRKAVKWDD